ncbi:MAG: hypothetical protein QOF39_3367, partial [Frankiales bacterium]|nr:hypothetical protein [Frankiales bacterium]
MEAAQRNRSRWQFSPFVLVAILAMLAAVVLMPFGRTARAADPLISQGKTTTASSVENAGTPAASGTDGNTGTRWSSAFSDPQWLEVDLGATANITQVVLNWEAAYGKSFQIQTSNDNATWTSIYSTTTGAGGVQTLALTGSGRYVRMYGTVRGSAYGYSLWEFQVYGSFGTTGGGCGTTNAAQGKPAVASSVEATGNPASAAVDGNTGTRWSSAFSDPQWIYVDLGASQSICQVTLNWEAAYATAFQIQTSPDASTWTSIYSTTSGTGGVQTLNISGTGRYVRMYGTTRATAYGYSLWEMSVLVTGTVSTTPPPPPGCTGQSDTPSFGPNVHIFDPSMSAATIQAQLDTDFNAQKDTNTAQFSDNRVAELYKPGTYAVNDNVGFYTSVAGLGLNPDDVVINGNVTVDAFNSSDGGNATQNFWREADNLSINPSSGSDRWAVAQAAPFRRIDVHGGLQLAPASNGYASGGYISDSKVSGQVSSVSQQQWYSQNSNFGSWAGGVWNMVFAGVTGAPAASFPNPPETVLATTPVARDIPYLYVTSDGKYHVFVPSLRTNASGTSWPNTAGTSVPMNQFYVVKSGDTSGTIQAALDQGCNLFFTPGVYHLSSTLNVNNANAVVLGIGYPTLIPDGGVDAMHVANVDGVR